MRKTKIICTLGPAVEKEEVLKQLFLKGMNCARMNFSHGSHEEHKSRLDVFKKVRAELGLPVPVLLDTKGPEIRIGTFEQKNVTLVSGNEFTLVAEDIVGTDKAVTVLYRELYKDVKEGTKILIDDGLIALEVIKVEGTSIRCKVLNGGSIGNNKGVNVPGTRINLPAITEKDIEDIKFGIRNGYDFIAASFVRKASDVVEIKNVLEENNGAHIKVIAKIENQEGVENIDEILKVSDGIMVARGDLGVEVPVEEVPIIQKRLIEKCYMAGKPVITATQMLDSMIRNPRPTRAEASDVANAIYDGTSAIMLSGETAAGKYPLEAVSTMARIADRAEMSINYKERFAKTQYENMSSVTNAISHATCTTAQDLNAAAIITFTHSGNTARMISKYRPQCPIIATCVSEVVQRQLGISWGVVPFLVDEVSGTDHMFEVGVEKAFESGMVKNGELVVITAGIPVGMSGTTNILKVHVVGKVLVQGNGICGTEKTGQLCVVSSAQEAINKFSDGDILVVPYVNDEMLPLIKRAKGLVVEEPDATGVDMSIDIPIIVNAENATKILKSGSVVTVDAKKGIVHFRTKA